MQTPSTSTTMAALRRAATALTVAGSLVPSAANIAATGPPGLSGRSGPPVAPGASTAVPPAGAPTDLTSLRGTWEWPLAPRPQVLAPFVAPASAYGSGHRGLDLAAGQGQAVTAADAGVVTHVGVLAGRGTVTVTHESGLRSTYEPVDGSVSAGQRVTAGQRLGVVRGRTHCGGSCLHLGALTDRERSGYTDPRPLLGGSRVILLPLNP